MTGHTMYQTGLLAVLPQVWMSSCPREGCTLPPRMLVLVTYVPLVGNAPNAVLT